MYVVIWMVFLSSSVSPLGLYDLILLHLLGN